MAFTTFTYTKSWRNSTDFPTVQTVESQVRDDMQILYDEIANGPERDGNGGLNGLISSIKTIVNDNDNQLPTSGAVVDYVSSAAPKADWDAASGSAAEILNKPTIRTIYVSSTEPTGTITEGSIWINTGA